MQRVLTTPQGWWLIVVGCGVGFLFALVALCISVVSFPLMLDRHAGAGEAMVTSLRVAARNPVTMAAWGLIVAALLVAGSLPFFLGLAIVIPLLGHATWHLYRKVIAPDPNLRPDPAPPAARTAPGGRFPGQPVSVAAQGWRRGLKAAEGRFGEGRRIWQGVDGGGAVADVAVRARLRRKPCFGRGCPRHIERAPSSKSEAILCEIR